jgi:NitT/TauT family transport system substrate-binding protein
MTNRRGGVLRLALAVGAALAASLWSAGAEAQVKTVRLAKQFGISYLPLTIMEDKKLLEEQAKKLGVEVRTEWLQLSAGSPMNEALISGNLDFASGGVGPLLTIWSRTRANLKVKGVAAINSMPIWLTTINPGGKTIKDFTEKDRIALPAVKVSMQAIILQMAAAKEFGEANFQKLDPLTVSLAHPDATSMMLSGRGEVVANFSSSPFQYRQQKQAGIRPLFSSEDVLGGAVSFNVIATTAKFREENPKLYKSFLSALQEATDFINKDKSAAAEIYLKLSTDKSPKEEIVELMSKPGVRFTTELFGLDKFVAFMAKTGSLRNPPKDWRAEMTFPDAK